MLWTLGDARTYVADEVSGGSCPSSDAVRKAINNAQMEILGMETPYNSLRRIRFSVRNNTIIAPRGVEKVETYRVDGYPDEVKSMFYEFLPGGSWSSDELDGVLSGVVDWGDHWATMWEIPANYEPLRLYAFSSEAADSGLLMTIKGCDTNNQDIHTSGVPGETLQIVPGLVGVTITANNATWKPSAHSYKQIFQVVKPVTKGYVALMTQDPTSNLWWCLAMYHPRETQPRFHRYKVTTPRDTAGTCIVALVKLRHEPLEEDSDILVVQNMEAMKLKIISNEYRKTNMNLSKNYLSDCLALLRREVAMNTPDTDVTLSSTWGLGRIEMV
jgi:hypothetical protein